MGNYGNAAVRAAKSLASGRQMSPREAWDDAVMIEYPTQSESRKKGCPRGAFIGLCEAGFVSGVTRTGSDKLSKNGEYAVAAVKAVRRNPALARSRSDLWRLACLDQPKAQNGQMDVVLALLTAGMLNSA